MGSPRVFLIEREIIFVIGSEVRDNFFHINSEPL